MKIIILAGGGGTRLFPLSRTCYPKQFIKIGDDQSLFSKTVQRSLLFVDAADIIVVTNQEYFHHVKAELDLCDAQGSHIILEPQRRNTAPAITLAVRYCLDKLQVAEGEVLLITPSDHVINPHKEFVQTINEAVNMAKQNWLVTLGVKPNQAKTGYGYIQTGETITGTAFRVRSFTEKPNKETAERYLNDGHYLWNSGIFTFTISCYWSELSKHQPEMYQLAQGDLETLISHFDQFPNQSIDYAIAEKSDNIVTIPLKTDWADSGSWDEIYDAMSKDVDGNAVIGDCVTLECQNTLMIGNNRLVAGIGLEDLVIIETTDAILVAKKGDSQKVKQLVTELSSQGRKEVCDNTTMYRPWGSYTVLGEGPGYKMKKITVTSGQRLSLQLHYHRSEHWIVIAGTAKVTIGDSEKMVHENESVFVPQSTKHRLENPGRIPLEIIEVQNGTYLEEDDIVRFDDVYGRL